MVDAVYLMGAEDVRSAGSAISSAAREMQQAAMSIEGALVRHERFLDDWLARFAQVLDTYPGGGTDGGQVPQADGTQAKDR